MAVLGACLVALPVWGAALVVACGYRLAAGRARYGWHWLPRIDLAALAALGVLAGWRLGLEPAALLAVQRDAGAALWAGATLPGGMPADRLAGLARGWAGAVGPYALVWGAPAGAALVVAHRFVRFGSAAIPGEEEGRTELRFHDLGRLAAGHERHVAWALPRIIGSGVVTLVSAPPGLGKGWWLQALVRAIAGRGPVLRAAHEASGPGPVVHRGGAVRRGHGPPVRHQAGPGDGPAPGGGARLGLARPRARGPAAGVAPGVRDRDLRHRAGLVPGGGAEQRPGRRGDEPRPRRAGRARAGRRLRPPRHQGRRGVRGAGGRPQQPGRVVRRPGGPPAGQGPGYRPPDAGVPPLRRPGPHGPPGGAPLRRPRRGARRRAGGGAAGRAGAGQGPALRDAGLWRPGGGAAPPELRAGAGAGRHPPVRGVSRPRDVGRDGELAPAGRQSRRSAPPAPGG